jgi:hypothetical protein
MKEAPQVIDRDDHYEKYANGVVYDTKTGLEWIAGPGKNMDWQEAKEWAMGLDIDGGGWIMPSRKEFETLYQEGRGKRNMTRLLETPAWWAWSAEHEDNLSSSLFDFSGGTRDWYSRTPRAYAVRVRK